MSYIGAEPTTAAFPFDQFSGDGTTTAFTLTYAPASATSIVVAISGVVQNPNLYSVVSTTLTFSPAPPSGTSNIAVLYLGLPVITGSSPGNTAFLSATDLTATASQTVFASAGSYTPGFVQVYRNGARLGAADFTATNGTTITLATAATAGDLVTIEYYTLTSLTNALPLTGGTVTGSTTFTAALIGTTGTFSGAVQASGVATNLYPLVSGTAVASTSGTSIDFTSIPSWVKRITVMFSGVSTSGTSIPLFQVGTGGTPTTSGYLGASSSIDAATASTTNLTTGFGCNSASAASVIHGAIIITNITGNTWVANGTFSKSNAASTIPTAGSVALAGTLNMVRITTVNGTDTFDAGSVNILYEG